METVICWFHEFGCRGEYAYERSQFAIWYWGHVRAIWEGWFPGYSYVNASAELNRVHDYYTEIAGFLFAGYWLIPLLIFGVWKVTWAIMSERDPELTRKYLAWLMIKWTVIVVVVGFVCLVALTIACLGIVLPVVAEGVGRPMLANRGRW